MKLLPVTVIVKAGPPLNTMVGDNDVAIGIGCNDASTVTVGLFATFTPLTNSRNSYVPGSLGIVKVQDPDDATLPAGLCAQLLVNFQSS